MRDNKLNARRTQVAIKQIKDFFQVNLALNLNLTRVSAPMFVRPETGLNDNLSGVERPVSFSMGRYDISLEIVQSLAKWKRMALHWYGFSDYEGLYTDMNAIRADETLDATHSIYVDQWDWEKIIREEDRNDAYLFDTVKKIFNVFKETENMINEKYRGYFREKLPDEIFFVTAEELYKRFPDLTPDERERKIAQEKKAVFIQAIGYDLPDGVPHSMRSPDYDDWTLNGDIIFWNPILDAPLELSSMGIRVDKDNLLKQIEYAGKEERLVQGYHRALVDGDLPQTIGGGIGQSRICMFFLEKEHIGEVQASIWDEETIRRCAKKNIELL
ncbi:MAG: aspartate--ammonia ligase [Tissierellia bacterium]|nr:aspartate--ammonia ligase [Tissierellia bacterium]